MATVSAWEVSPVVCQHLTGPELLLICISYPGRVTLHIGGGTADEARALAAELIAVANQLDAQKAVSTKLAEAA